MLYREEPSSSHCFRGANAAIRFVATFLFVHGFGWFDEAELERVVRGTFGVCDSDLRVHRDRISELVRSEDVSLMESRRDGKTMTYLAVSRTRSDKDASGRCEMHEPSQPCKDAIYDR